MAEALEEAVTPPAPKKPKSLSGAAKYGSKFNPEWQSEYPFASPGHVDKVYSFYCSVCMKDVSCSHQGVADLKRHEKSAGHTSKIQASSRLDRMGLIPVGGALNSQVGRGFVLVSYVHILTTFL